VAGASHSRHPKRRSGELAPSHQGRPLEVTETIPLIAGYELLEKVGEGGRGVVYRACQLSLQRTVAVKVVRTPRRGAAPLNFEGETRLLASLSHPNVLAIHDFIPGDKLSLLVTEFVEGTSLRAMMQSGPWPISKTAALLDKVARALSYIHEHGILHLDLKPENILCPPGGEIKLADFGLAQASREAQAGTDLDQAEGTVDYSSLEQRHGLAVDERSDVYSLAVLSYELLTGRLPGRAYEKVSRYNVQLPAAVDEVLRCGLARRAEHRPASVEAFRSALLAALLPKTKKRLALAAALVLIMVLVAWFVTGQKGSNQPTLPAPQAPHVWLLGDEPDSLAAFDGMIDGRSEPARFLQVSTRAPEGETDPPLPRWPEPRPAMFVRSTDADGFFHPLYGPTSGRTFLAAWPAAARWPRRLPEDNFVLAGDFSGKRLWEHDGDGPWKKPPTQVWNRGNGIEVACPPDRPDDPALLLDKSEGAPAEVMCFQWLRRAPEPGTVMFLRYRARAEEGTGRLTIGPTMPLYLPNEDRGPLAEALRKRSKSHAYLAPQPGMEAREYRLEDCIQPSPEWRTYCVVWEWPPYCTEGNGRNVVIEYRGTGKAWVDDVEIFVWPSGTKP